jgi:7-keto-8-aminopelargonate synthetase-like enzyme
MTPIALLGWGSTDVASPSNTSAIGAGAALMFSGPLQPPMLGAAVASAKLHLTPELAELQQTLHERIVRVHELASEQGIKLGTRDLTPIAFVPCGPDDAMFELFHRLGAAGFYIAPAVFPAVAQNKAGLRLTVSLHNSVDDTARLMKTMRAEMDKIVAIPEYQASL